MTGERLCIHCWHRESDRVIIHDEEQGDVEYCEPCGAGHGVHPFEAAPSTDEGEAQERLFLDVGLAWTAYWARRHRLDPIEQAEETLSTARRNFEAAIRAPLEERIRELEAEVSSWSTQAETSEEEAKRLREALRTYLAVHDVWSDREHIIDRVAAANEYVEALANLRALATPPSSTEGTKEVEG